MQISVVPAGQGRAYWVVGGRYTFLATGDDTGGAYALFHAEVTPGGGPPPHIHRREDEAFYMLEGDLAVEVDGRPLRASAGTWLTLPRGSLHAFKNVGATNARMLILVSPAGLENYFAEVGQEATDPKAPPPPPDIDKLLAVAPKYGLEIRPPR
jgi:quercetin dioxygenase-like cupin family protein